MDSVHFVTHSKVSLRKARFAILTFVVLPGVFGLVIAGIVRLSVVRERVIVQNASSEQVAVRIQACGRGWNMNLAPKESSRMSFTADRDSHLFVLARWSDGHEASESNGYFPTGTPHTYRVQITRDGIQIEEEL